MQKIWMQKIRFLYRRSPLYTSEKYYANTKKGSTFWWNKNFEQIKISNMTSAFVQILYELYVKWLCRNFYGKLRRYFLERFCANKHFSKSKTIEWIGWNCVITLSLVVFFRVLLRLRKNVCALAMHWTFIHRLQTLTVQNLSERYLRNKS